jgi:hypothetical protein
MASPIVLSPFVFLTPPTTHPTPTQCLDTVDATAKAIYERCFRWLVFRMDLMLQSAELIDARYTVGILDIFGFENMAGNGFEQLCINLANERLQLYFNQNIFDMELRDYEEEGIDAVNIEFVSNIGTLDLLLRRPLGLLALLDEESRFPTSTDVSLVAKLQAQLGQDKSFLCKGASDAFGVQHYAGAVQYTATGFLERNRDPLSSAVVEVLSGAGNHLIAELFGESVAREQPLPQLLVGRRRPRTSKASNRMSLVLHRTSVIVASWQKAARRGLPLASGEGGADDFTEAPVKAAATVGGQFRYSLHEMVQRMERCDPHFIRCLRPNTRQEPSTFDAGIVLRQLQHTGVLETTRIRKQGYSHRVPLPLFVQRYHGLAFTYGSTPPPSAATCKTILEKVAAILGPATAVSGHVPALQGWQLGHTKVFLKYWHPDALNLVLLRHDRGARAIQAGLRGFRARSRARFLLACARTQNVETTTFMSELHTRAYKSHAALEQLVDEDLKRAAVAAAASANRARLAINATTPGAVSAAPAPGRAAAEVLPQVPQSLSPSASHTGAGPGDVNTATTSEESPYLTPAPPGMLRRGNWPSRRLASRKLSTRKHNAVHTKSMRKHEKSVVSWWTRTERPKGNHCDSAGVVHAWFHGLLDRSQADDLLEEMPDGYFLLRVCRAFHGHALSYRDQGRVRHHRIAFETQTGHYQAQGKAEGFESLEELIEYYAMVPLEPEGGTLRGYVKCAHAYNLGSLDADVEGHAGVDLASRADPSRRRESKQKKQKVSRRQVREGGGRERRVVLIGGGSEI